MRLSAFKSAAVVLSDEDLATIVNTPTTTFINSAATTNATLIKGSAGTLYSIIANNTNAAVRYLKLYNKATAPVVGTDVPVLTLHLPINNNAAFPVGSNGVRFNLGIGIAMTVSPGDSATDAVAANEIKAAISFI